LRVRVRCPDVLLENSPVAARTAAIRRAVEGAVWVNETGEWESGVCPAHR
jgi:hypothetical protein